MTDLSSTPNPTRIRLSTILQDQSLRYRILVLLYDLSNVGSNKQSAQRLSATTHELYMSEPYFRDAEALEVRNALTDKTTSDRGATNAVVMTTEQAIQRGLANFLEKRKASGDSRPCGPHDLFPVFAGVFGVEKLELKDEKFLARLKRSGLKESEKPRERAPKKAGSNKSNKKSNKNESRNNQ